MIRTLLADNHALFRAGLRRLLEDSEQVKVVAEAGSAAEALEKLAVVAVDVAVLDIQMPGPGIQTLLRTIAERHPTRGHRSATTWVEERRWVTQCAPLRG